MALCIALSAVIGLASGCQNWPQSKRAMQYQIESERLLSEFRAQKKRADELESRNRLLSERLSESEKLLARLQPSSAEGRIAARSAGLQPENDAGGYSTESQNYSAQFQSRMRSEAGNPPPTASLGMPSTAGRPQRPPLSESPAQPRGETQPQQPAWRPIHRS